MNQKRQGEPRIRILPKHDMETRQGSDVDQLELNKKRANDPPANVLREREIKVLHALCLGFSRDEAASLTGFSRSTLDKIICEMYVATGYKKVYQVVAWAFRIGVFVREVPDSDSFPLRRRGWS